MKMKSLQNMDIGRQNPTTENLNYSLYNSFSQGRILKDQSKYDRICATAATPPNHIIYQKR